MTCMIVIIYGMVFCKVITIILIAKIPKKTKNGPVHIYLLTNNILYYNSYISLNLCCYIVAVDVLSLQEENALVY